MTGGDGGGGGGSGCPPGPYVITGTPTSHQSLAQGNEPVSSQRFRSTRKNSFIQLCSPLHLKFFFFVFQPITQGTENCITLSQWVSPPEVDIVAHLRFLLPNNTETSKFLREHGYNHLQCFFFNEEAIAGLLRRQ